MDDAEIQLEEPSGESVEFLRLPAARPCSISKLRQTSCGVKGSRPGAENKSSTTDMLAPEKILDTLSCDESGTVLDLAVDRKSASYLSTCLDSKTSGHALAFLVKAIKELWYNRLTLKSNREPTILKLKDDVSGVFDSGRVCPK